jgi:hypothetical protein
MVHLELLVKPVRAGFPGNFYLQEKTMELIIAYKAIDPFNERDTFIEFVEATATLFSFMDFAGVQVTHKEPIARWMESSIQIPYKGYSQMSDQEINRTAKLQEAISIVAGSSVYELEWGG